MEPDYQGYEDACEGWAERYAEAGSGHVFSGGSSTDAYLVAYWAAGPRPTREEFGLPPLTFAEPTPQTIDDDVPF